MKNRILTKNLAIVALFAFIVPYYSVRAQSQYLGPQSGDQPQSFSTLPDNLGFLSSSINQFNGQVQFSIPIMKLNGRGSLSYNFLINYSSANLANVVSTWNREAPTSVLGLGWSFDMPRIIVDHKGTTTRADDEFFIVENGTTNPLIYKGPGLYYTENYMDWIIQYDSVNEIWTITKEDGTVYKYGDKNSGRFTVQYMVRWANWIGDSAQPVGQQQLVYIWNLSQIKNIWSDQITFTYIQDLENVGTGSAQHTKASYLSQITNLNNEKISFVYQLKTANGTINEYQDPHTEATEPDAYQEIYESKYLDRVIRYDETGAELFDVRFGYSFLGTAELAKRELSSITQYSALGNALPGMNFTYDPGTTGTTNAGALISVQSPTKGVTSFTYTKITLPNTSRSFVFGSVSSYKEPHVFYGEDYVVITRRYVPSSGHTYTPQDLVVDVVTWDGGKWIPQSLGSIGNVSLNSNEDPTSSQFFAQAPKQDLEVATGVDFFAVYNETTGKIFLCKRNNRLTGNWYFFSDNIPVTVATDPYNHSYNCYEGYSSTLSVVGNSIFIGSLEGYINSNRIYYYDPQSTTSMNNWSHISVSKPVVDSPTGEYGIVNNQYFYTATNNYFITHLDTKNTTDNLIFTYLTPGTSNAPTLTQQTISIGGTFGNSYWYGSNSFAVMLPGGGSSYPDRIYYWDENYNIQMYNIGVAESTDSFVSNINNAMAVISNVNEIRGFRFDGVNWNPTAALDYGGGNFTFRSVVSFGNDLILRPRPANYFGAAEFNPNTLSWTTPSPINYQTTSATNSQVLLAGHNFVNLAGKYFFRNTSGVWVPDPYNSHIIYDNSSTPDDYYLQGGLDFVAPGSAYGPAFVENIKNGAVVAALSPLYFWNNQEANTEYVWDRPNNTSLSPQCDYNTLVTFLDVGGSTDGVTFGYMSDAYRLKLHRRINGSFIDGLDNQDQFIETISLFVATGITANDNVQTTSTVFSYNVNTATVDATGSLPQFNHVRTILGSSTASSTPYGYTDAYFFNGISSSNISSMDYTAPTMPATASTFYRLCNGVQYATLVFDNGGNNLSQSIIDYQYYDFNSQSRLGKAFFIRPLSTSSVKDNMNVNSSLGFGINTGSTPLVSKSVTGTSDSYIDNYQYYSDIYGTPGNLISIAIYNLNYRWGAMGTLSKAVATRWKTWGTNNVPAPYQTYVWKSGSTDFSSYWSPSSTVPSNWKLLSAVNSMDLTRGLVNEILGSDGIVECTIWHSSKPIVLAKVNNAGIAQVYYEGFEYWTGGNTNTVTPLAGSTYYSFPAGGATLNFTLQTSGTYKITYWTRTNQSSSWTLVESTFTGSSYALNLSGVDVDEIRIHPINAFMVSISYDRYGNRITECDANNKVSYFEYDEFNRLKLTRDENRNILEYNTYNIKN